MILANEHIVEFHSHARHVAFGALQAASSKDELDQASAVFFAAEDAAQWESSLQEAVNGEFTRDDHDSYYFSCDDDFPYQSHSDEVPF